MNRLEEVEQMTLTEFHYKRYAQEYKEVDDEYRMHKMAFLNRNATATQNKGTDKNPKEEYVFKQFKDFFDYEKALKTINEPIEDKKEEETKKKLSPAQIAAAHNKKAR